MLQFNNKTNKVIISKNNNLLYSLFKLLQSVFDKTFDNTFK